MTVTLNDILSLPRLRIGGIQIIRDPVRTFSDENGVRDTQLAPSELRTVRDALDKLGIKPTFTPTGRYVEIALHECMERAYHNAAAASQRGQKRLAQQWRDVAVKAKRALAQVPRQEAS